MKKNSLNAWDQTLKFLAKNSQSEARLSQKLKAKGFSEDEIRLSLKKANSYGFLDDRAYALRLALKSASQGKDETWIAAKLKFHGISKELILELIPREKVIEYLDDV